MAARRLLIVMLVLLGLSTLAAALVPPQSLREGETDSTASTEQTESVPLETVPRGEPLKVKVRADTSKVQVVPIAAGDQLTLTVTARKADQVEVPGFGLVQAVSPAAPAHFELLAERTGSYGVRLVDAKRVVARIEVAERPAKTRARAESGPA